MNKPTALITGATSGLGEAMAAALAGNGYQVWGTGRSVEPHSVENSINFLPLDFRNAESLTSFFQHLTEMNLIPDVLILNAGVGAAGPLEDYSREEIEEAFQVNLFGNMQILSHFVPEMVKRGSGRIVQISSIAGQLPLPFQGLYSATKHAMESMICSLRMECRNTGVQLTILQPGDIQSKVHLNRIYATSDTDSRHKQGMEGFYKIITDKVQQAQPASTVGIKLLRLLKKRRWRRRYRVGDISQRITPMLQNILPDPWVEKLLLGYYKMD